MHTVHIIQHQHGKPLKKQLLQNHNSLHFTEVLPFNIAFKMDYDAAEIMLETYHIIKALPLKTLSTAALNPSNIESYLALIQDLHLYGIDPSTLPQDTSLQKDNYCVINAIVHLIPKPQVNKDIQYIAYDHFLSHAELSFLKHHNIQINTIESIEPIKTHQKSLNVRHEFESAIQYILKERISNPVFVVPNLADKLPLIESILLRYNMPIKLQDRSPLLVRKKYQALLDYMNQPTQNNLIGLIENHAFSLKASHEMIFLIKHFNLSNVLPTSLKSTQKDVDLIITRNMEDYTDFVDAINMLLQATTLQEQIIAGYQHLLELNQDNLSPLKQFIEAQAHLYDDALRPFMIHQLKKIDAVNLDTDAFTFYDLNDFSIETESNVFAIDMGSKNFPAVSANTGILDESYRKDIPCYPSLEVRTKHQLKQKYTFTKRSNHLNISYSITNYEGKAQEPSFEMFHDAKSITLAPIYQKTSPIQQDFKLNPGYVNELLKVDGKIRSSITALEMYSSDPVNFFIQSALKYREPRYPQMGPLELGNFNHDYLEAKMKNTAIQDDLWSQFPETDLKIKMVQARNEKLMTQNLEFIQESLEASVLHPTYFEYEFEEAELFPQFIIRGKVDRVDIFDDEFMIIDYKSSKNILNVRSIQDGQQLQLLTYGFILEKHLQKNLLGVYYLALRCGNNAISQYSYAATKGLSSVESEPKHLWLSERRYLGILFQEIHGEFSSSAYHQRLRTDKLGEVLLHGKPFNKILTHQVIREVYQRLYTSISSGNFNQYEVERNLKAPQYLKLTEEDNEL